MANGYTCLFACVYVRPHLIFADVLRSREQVGLVFFEPERLGGVDDVQAGEIRKKLKDYYQQRTEYAPFRARGFSSSSSEGNRRTRLEKI